MRVTARNADGTGHDSADNVALVVIVHSIAVSPDDGVVIGAANFNVSFIKRSADFGVKCAIVIMQSIRKNTDEIARDARAVCLDAERLDHAEDHIELSLRIRRPGLHANGQVVSANLV